VIYGTVISARFTPLDSLHKWNWFSTRRRNSVSRPCYFCAQLSSWLSGRHFGEPKLDAPNSARFIKSAKAHIAGFRRGVTLFQKVAHFRTIVEFVRDDQITSLAAGDHSGRQVD